MYTPDRLRQRPLEMRSQSTSSKYLLEGVRESEAPTEEDRDVIVALEFSV
jgi:hypothetical protein